MADQTENAYQKQEAISIGGRASKAFKSSKKGKVGDVGCRDLRGALPSLSCFCVLSRAQLRVCAPPLRGPRPPPDGHPVGLRRRRWRLVGVWCPATRGCGRVVLMCRGRGRGRGGGRGERSGSGCFWDQLAAPAAPRRPSALDLPGQRLTPRLLCPRSCCAGTKALVWASRHRRRPSRVTTLTRSARSLRMCPSVAASWCAHSPAQAPSRA